MNASLNYAKPLQVDVEMDRLIELLCREKIKSYLEIGARYGGSFERIIRATGAKGVAVDFPGWNFGDANSAPILLSTVSRLKRSGFNASVIFGPSSAPEVYARAADAGPYDAVLIDADHSYEAVKRDFFIYAPLARLVVLHDVAAPEGTKSRAGNAVEVPRFWNEIKQSYRHEEITAPDTNMGVGVIWMT